MTRSAQTSILFSMLCSQNLRTDHPSLRNFLVILLSLSMFLSILSLQNFFDSFLFEYSYPCQKSPSQNITIRFLFNAKSGLSNILGCISYEYPMSFRTSFIFSSIFVFFPFIRDMTHDLFSFEKISAMNVWMFILLFCFHQLKGILSPLFHYCHFLCDFSVCVWMLSMNRIQHFGINCSYNLQKILALGMP